MCNKEIYIHVGLPRTATTYLQRSIFPYFNDIKYVDLSDNKYSIFRDLYFKNFIFYPLSNIKEHIREYFCSLNQKKILISDEMWFGGTIGGTHFNFSNNYFLSGVLKEIFPNAKIILTIRRQDKWFESIYRYLLRDGHYVGIRQFLNYRNGEFYDYSTYFRKGPNIDVKILDYKKYIENYIKLFGENNILIIPQELLAYNKELFINKVETFLGSSYSAKGEYSKKANTGYLLLGVILSRVFNRFFIFENREGGLIPISKNKFLDYRTYVRFIDKKIPINKSILSNDMRIKILQYYADSNNSLDNQFKLSLKKFKYYE